MPATQQRTDLFGAFDPNTDTFTCSANGWVCTAKRDSVTVSIRGADGSSGVFNVNKPIRTIRAFNDALWRNAERLNA